MSLVYEFDEEEPARSYLAELDSPYFTTNTKLHVLISGAGIAGLMLAILLEHLDISYEIIERCREMKPLGKYSSAYVLILSLIFSYHMGVMV
jgi:ribulose 1,5-bisphosphate synthetase/thiazole synthase